MTTKTLKRVYNACLALALLVIPAAEISIIWTSASLGIGADAYAAAAVLLTVQVAAMAAVITLENEALRRGEELTWPWGQK